MTDAMNRSIFLLPEVTNKAPSQDVPPQENLGSSDFPNNSEQSANIAQSSNSQGFLDNSPQPNFQETLQGLDVPSPMEGVQTASMEAPKQQDQLWPYDWTPTVEDIVLRYRDMEQKGQRLLTPEEMAFKAEGEAQKQADMTADRVAGELLKRDTLQKAISHHLTTYGITQDQDKRARVIGDLLDIPKSAVLSDMPRYEKEFATKKLGLSLKDDEAMLAFFSERENFERAKEDMEQYGVISRTLGGLSRGYIDAGKRRDESLTNFNEMVMGVEPTLFERGKQANDWAGWLSEQAGGLAGNIQDSAVYSGLPAGAVAGVAGSVIPGAGSALGFGTGLTAGIAIDQSRQTLGDVYVETFRTLINEGVPKAEAISTARMKALERSVPTVALNVVPVGGVVGRFGNQVLGKIEGSALGNIASSTARGAVEGGVSNTLQEAFNVTAPIEGLQDYDIAVPPELFDEAKNRVLAAAGTGVLGGSTMSLAGSTLGSAINRVRSKAPEALQDEQTLVQTIEEVKVAKSAIEDKEVLNNFLQTRLSGEKGESAHIPLEKVQEMATLHPEAFAKIAEKVPDIDQQIQLATETGADITLPTASILAYMQEDAKAFVPDMKLSPDGMSGNEARQTIGELDTATREAIDSAVSQVNEGIVGGEFLRRERLRRTLEDGIYSAFKGTFNKQQRKDLAEYYTSYFEATSKANNRFYGDALDEYTRRPILFQKTAEDEAINKAQVAIERDYNRKKAKAEASKVLSEQSNAPSVVTGEGGDVTFRGTKLSEGKVYVGDESIPTEIMVVEADTLSPTFEASENQPRNREAKASEAQIQRYTKIFKPEYLRGDFPDMTHGAPTLSRDGRIVGGNGRVETIKRKYAEGGAEEYRAMVQEEARKAGVSIGGMKNPVLIRVFKKDVDVERAAFTSNKGSGLQYSPIEQARADALDLPDVSQFTFNENGTLSATGNSAVMRSYLSNKGIEEQGGFVDADGDLTTAGQRRVQNAILYRAYGDTPLLGRMIEDISPEGVNINSAMARIAPEMMRIEGMIEKGQLHNFSLKDDLLKAIDAYLLLKRKGGSVESYIKQEDAFNGLPAPEIAEFMRILDNNSRSSKGLASEILKAYKKIEQLGDPQFGNLLGDPVPASKAELLSDIGRDNLSSAKQDVFPATIQKIEQRLALEAPNKARERQIDQQLLSEIQSKWRDAFSAENTENIDGKTIQEANKVRNYTKITEQEVEALSALEESFIASISESVGMSQRAFYDAYKLIPNDRRNAWDSKGGYFGKDNTGYNVKLHGNDTISRFATLSHEMGHYFLEVLTDINKLVKNGEIPENSVSPKFKETISDLRAYFVDNYTTLAEKQREKYKQNTQYESYHYLKEIEDNGGAELFGRVFDEGLWISDSEVQKINEIGAVNQSQANKYIKTLQSARSIMHEAFAEGFETYISKGEAPTPRLKELYRWIALWIKDAWDFLTENRRTNDRFGKNVDIQKDREFAYNPQLKKIFDDILATQEEQVKTFVSLRQGNRGALTFGDGDIPKMMSLFRDGDISTMIHEKGHGILQDLRADALDPNLVDAVQRKEDWQATKDWFKESTEYLLTLHRRRSMFGNRGADRKAELQLLREIDEKGGVDYVHSIIDGDLLDKSAHGNYLYTVFHEVFARGMERYVMEGKAPNAKLLNVFQRFAKALFDIYKAVDALKAPINDNIREVFGRLIASDGEATRARTEANLNPLFPTREASGMSEPEYSRYLKGIQGQQSKLLQKTINRNMQALLKEKTAEGKEKIESNKKRIEEGIRQEKAMQTYVRMSGEGAGFKINEDDVKARKLKGFVPPELVSKEGYSLETLAEMMGYERIDDLADDLSKLETMRRQASSKKITIDEAVSKIAEKRARQEFKDSIDPESLYNEAVDAMHLSEFENALTAEINSLGRLASGEDLPEPTVPMDDFVKALPDVVTVEDLKKWIRVERTAGDKNRTLERGTSSDFIQSFINRRTQKLARKMQAKGIEALEKTEKALEKSKAKEKALENVRIRVSEINFEAMESYVRDIFDNDPKGKLSNPQRFLAQERRSGERAQKYLLEGKPEKAYLEKVDQILARMMYEEARNRGMNAIKNIDAGAVEARVSELMSNMDMRDAMSRSRLYLNSERRAGASALNHMREGKYREAYDAKMKQLTSYMMYKEALKFKDMKKQADRLYTKISKNKTLKNVNPDAMAIMHLILQDQGYRTARDQTAMREERFAGELQAYFGKDKDGNPLSLPEAIRAFLTKGGDLSAREGIYIPEMFLSPDASSRKAITVSQHQDLFRMMSSIFAHGREEQTLYLNGKREDMKQAIDGALAIGMAGRGEFVEMNRGSVNSVTRMQAFKEFASDRARNISASVTRAGVIFNRLDRDKAGGLFNRLFSNLHVGMGKFRKWTEGFDDSVMGLKQKWGADKYREYIDSLNNDFIVEHTLGDHDSTKGRLLSLKRSDVLSILLNSGTHDNYRKLIDGRATRADGTATGWTDEAIDAFLMEHVTKEDVEFAQIIWREIGKTWNDLEAVEKRLRGIAPDKVLTRTIRTKFGEVEGGYFPLKYEDTGKSTKESMRLEDMQSFGDAMNGMIASSSKNRLTNVRKPVSLDMWRAIEEARRSAYAVYIVEPYNDMAKVLKDGDIKKMIEHVFSPQHYKSLIDLMDDIKSPARRNVGYIDYVQRWGTHLTIGATITNFMYVAKPILDGMADVVSVPFKKGVRFPEYLGALQRIISQPSKEYKWAQEFDSVKNIQATQGERWQNWKDSVSARYGRAEEAYRAVLHFGWQMQEFTSRMNATVIARSAYEGFVKRNPLASMEDIHAHVNKVVREGSVNKNMLDTAPTQRNRYNEYQKMYLRFPLQATNAIMDAFYPFIDRITAPEGAPEGSRVKDIGNLVSTTIGAMLPVMSYYYLSGLLPRDEEGNIDWSRTLPMLIIGLFTQGHPIIRDFGDVVSQPDNVFAGANLSPQYRDLVRSVKDAMKLASSGESYGERQLFTGMRAVGTALHLPTGPLRAGNFVFDWATDETSENMTFPDFVKQTSRGYYDN